MFLLRTRPPGSIFFMLLSVSLCCFMLQQNTPLLTHSLAWLDPFLTCAWVLWYFHPWEGYFYSSALQIPEPLFCKMDGVTVFPRITQPVVILVVRFSELWSTKTKQQPRGIFLPSQRSVFSVALIYSKGTADLHLLWTTMATIIYWCLFWPDLLKTDVLMALSRLEAISGYVPLCT